MRITVMLVVVALLSGCAQLQRAVGWKRAANDANIILACEAARNASLGGVDRLPAEQAHAIVMFARTCLPSGNMILVEAE